ncbi:hypothetical protein QO002_003265 [Pararhizobium capsulatum DSM 1112]|uniref:Uncharacterized protein n=1 Tax=Pararhizobium capsulatum DSM 1112 TaxID=1121113 RepID=A0ABU0BWA1_9HYPH|nr:hypothetical protein [Pararhizobium capsulatum DSM 1112]
MVPSKMNLPESAQPFLSDGEIVLGKENNLGFLPFTYAWLAE